MRNLVRSILLGGATLLVVVAGARAQATGVVAGRVLSGEDGRPLAGAAVEAAGAAVRVRTGRDGRYALRLPAGVRELVAVRAGWAAARVAVEVPAGGRVEVDIRLGRAVLPVEEVVVVGGRGEARPAGALAVPVDVVTSEEIAASGLVETGEVLERLIPSLHLARAAGAGPDDAQRRLAARGLSPGHLVVLVDGRRWHESAWVPVSSPVGRGAAAPDPDAIPVSAIERIEVLRGGAAALYGPGAVAGVVNIVLRDAVGGRLASRVGQTTAGDGAVVVGAAGYGVEAGGRGRLTVLAELRDRAATDRTAAAGRSGGATGGATAGTGGAPVQRHGEPARQDVSVLVRGALELGGGAELYGLGGYGVRRAQSSGRVRGPDDAGAAAALHPDGFLPRVASDGRNATARLGARGRSGGWRWELGASYGAHALAFRVESSANPALGAAGPTAFDVGRLSHERLALAADAARRVSIGPVAAPLRVAGGVELYRERWRIDAGEPAAYRGGGAAPPAETAASVARPGVQGFPGFRPEDVVDAARLGAAAQLGVEAGVGERWGVGLAARVDVVERSGAHAAVRWDARWAPASGVALRAALGTGVRLPSPSQRHLSVTTEAPVASAEGGYPRIRVAPADRLAPGASGVGPLRAERTLEASAGLVLTPAPGVMLALDAYRIAVEDRIALSGDLAGAAVRARRTAWGLAPGDEVRTVANALDTRTLGLDVAAAWGVRAGGGLLRVEGALALARTRAARLAPAPPSLAGDGGRYLDRAAVGRVEEGLPRAGGTLSLRYDRDRFGAMLHHRWFGGVAVRGDASDGSLDRRFGGKALTDASVRCTLAGRLELAAGALNLFDVYPDPLPDRAEAGSGGGAGVVRYSDASPFGFAGARYYLRIATRF